VAIHAIVHEKVEQPTLRGKEDARIVASADRYEMRKLFHERCYRMLDSLASISQRNEVFMRITIQFSVWPKDASTQRVELISKVKKSN